MIKSEDSHGDTSIKDVKKKNGNCGESVSLDVPMSPEVAAIIHGHLPEPWVRQARFVGRCNELLHPEPSEKPVDNKPPASCQSERKTT